MSLEAIKQVTETEQSIQPRRAAAEAEARQITADAEKAGQALVKQARTEAAEQPFFGLILSGFLLAGKIGRQRFVCGLICGAFYALCLLAAAFLVHGVPSWTRSDAMLPLALLLGGTLGGALSAIKEGH